MALARRGDRRIHWEQWGSGPAVVLIPGTGAGVKQFGTLPRRFARHGLTCVVCSPVGIPPSSPLDGTFTLEDAARDVLAVLDAAAIHRCIPLGVSLGGKIGLVACGMAPERLPGLAMLASSVIRTPRAHRILRFFEVAAENLDGDQFGEAIAPFLFGSSFQAHRPELVADIARGLRPDDAARALIVAQTRAVQSFEGEALARAAACPTLCVGGGEDTLTPAADVRATAELMPHARYLEIPDAGHSLLLESPAVFDAVLEFVQDLIGE